MRSPQGAVRSPRAHQNRAAPTAKLRQEKEVGVDTGPWKETGDALRDVTTFNQMTVDWSGLGRKEIRE